MFQGLSISLLARGVLLASAMLFALALSGCQAFPDKLHQPLYHNPFPQLHRVAVLPFYNQSAEPTVDGEAIAMAYYNELQAIPGFEVMPVGVAKQMLSASGIEPRTPQDFQKLARLMNMDAILIGSVTEYSPYYPPRIGLAVDWYAANPSYHPIPDGYGLPWGTADEEFIPSPVVRDAEFALAREQLKTQTPELPKEDAAGEDVSHAIHNEVKKDDSKAESAVGLPPDWPDPRGFVPPPPAVQRPSPRPQYDPIITHTKIYHGEDGDFTQRLASYFYFRDDARFGGFDGYLQRPDDFVRFCCHLHVTETLAARGGAGESRVVYRWPISRYER